MRYSMIILFVTVMTTVGCQTTFTDDQVSIIKGKNDIVLSGTTGEVKGVDADSGKKAVKCKDCGFNKGSLRERMITAVTDDLSGVDQETIRKLKEHKDITISGDTGSIVGTSEHSRDAVKCDKCGFNKGSLRYRIIEAVTD
jgi:hypothetical protein